MSKYLCIKKALDFWGVLYTNGTSIVQGWLLQGNVANDTTDFIGTNNDANVRFKRNGIFAGFINALNTSFGIESGNYSLDNVSQAGNSYFGRKSGKNSIGSENSFFGASSGENNTESQVSSFGIGSGNGNSGLNLSSFGFESGSGNSGTNVSTMGASSSRNNSGDEVVSLGVSANENNTGDKVIALGKDAGKGNTQSNRFIVGLGYLPTFANTTAANIALPPSSVNGVYLYIDLSDKTIKAVI